MWARLALMLLGYGGPYPVGPRELLAAPHLPSNGVIMARDVLEIAAHAMTLLVNRPRPLVGTTPDSDPVVEMLRALPVTALDDIAAAAEELERIAGRLHREKVRAGAYAD